MTTANHGTSERRAGARRDRVLMKGNEAIAEAAIQAGCDAYFGYPITPQAELLEWMAKRMPEVGRVFVQAESELGAINMGLGAAATGARVLVSSSSPGISLMAEAMSYMAGSQTPIVLVNVMRGGPGLGSIQPSQGDYFQAVKGHGHGDYKVPVLAPATISEAVELVPLAFELAEKYRTPVFILADGILGQAMEPVELRFRTPERRANDWALTGADGRPPRVIKSLDLQAEDLERHNLELQAKFREIARREVRWSGQQLEDAEYVIVAYGTAARVGRTAVARGRARGLKVGLFRPITLWPFPERELGRLSARVRGILVVELSAGQMVEDVRLAVEGRCPVAFHGRMGGMVPTPDEVVEALRSLQARVGRRPRRAPTVPPPVAPTRLEPPSAPEDASRVPFEGEGWSRLEPAEPVPAGPDGPGTAGQRRNGGDR
ncbi:MAG: 3-methyl-2-oxobutanoate dehydrogenase subunit VorB [Candidatus Limnocylindrales bacterium]